MQETYMNPVKIFNSVDLPAPLGPIIAVNSPDLNSPDTPFRTVFWAKPIEAREKTIADYKWWQKTI